MPTTKELTIQMEDRPGTLGKVCKTLAERGVNIVAFQSLPVRPGESEVRFVVDNAETARSALNAVGVKLTERDVAQVKLPHRPGELARAASRLGEANININYGYCGIEPGTNAALLIFGVADATKAATVLDQAAAAAAGT